MNKRRAIVLGAVLLGVLLAAGVASAGVGTTYGVEWSVVAGGGQRSVGSQYAVHGTAGQAVIGPAYGVVYGVHSGFWYGIQRGGRIYLPLILRDYAAP